MHLKNMIESGEDMEKRLVTALSAELDKWLAALEPKVSEVEYR
jgi:hypothetical protein